MAVWFILFISLCLSAVLILFINLQKLPSSKIKKSKFTNPPIGPPAIPIIGHTLMLNKIFSAHIVGQFFHDLHQKYGGFITMKVLSTPIVFIGSHSLAHQALIQNSEALAHRPGPVTPGSVLNRNHHDIGSSSDEHWRLFRRNLTSEFLIPSRYKSFGAARKWALEVITEGINKHIASGKFVPLRENLRHAMFCLLLFLCFGEKLDEKVVKDIVEIEETAISSFLKFNIFIMLPKFGKFIFRKTWNQLLDIRNRQQAILLPCIKSRRERREKIKKENPDGYVTTYVDSLFNLEITFEGGRKLTDEEIVTLVSEFLDAGTDTTATVLEWILSHLTKDQKIQEKLYNEISDVVNGSGTNEVEEEDLSKMPYLKAVVLEGLRLHPPGHFALPHGIKEDIVLDGHLMPKNSVVNFLVAEMGRDPNVWKDPMNFKPERFMGDEGEVVDLTGTKEIKMMPFSAGRRICPGKGLATLHLEYFVACLIWRFKWMPLDGEEIDMEEKDEFTVVRKKDLRARVSPR